MGKIVVVRFFFCQVYLFHCERKIIFSDITEEKDPWKSETHRY